VSGAPAPRPITAADYAAIVAQLPLFWDGRDMRALHHPMFVYEFGDCSFVVPDTAGEPAAYLLGCIASARPCGYVHAVAVHPAHRGRGLARTLYDTFARHAAARGASEIKAITTPANAASVALHEALGMTAVLVEDYAGPGAARLVFRRSL
jgi:ribosomal protein S18 acetylase RimI-like enzyme